MDKSSHSPFSDAGARSIKLRHLSPSSKEGKAHSHNSAQDISSRLLIVNRTLCETVKHQKGQTQQNLNVGKLLFASIWVSFMKSVRSDLLPGDHTSFQPSDIYSTTQIKVAGQSPQFPRWLFLMAHYHSLKPNILPLANRPLSDHCYDLPPHAAVSPLSHSV